MKATITVLTIIMFIGLASAIIIYSGECNTITFPNTDDVNLTVTGNSSNMSGFNWNKDGTLITYCFDYNYFPDSFTLEWYNYQSVEESVGQSSSGGGSPGYSFYDTIEGGISKVVRLGEVLSFRINESKHTLVAHKIKDDYAIFKLQSKPMYINLSIGQEKKVVLDNPDYYDFYIKLNSINLRKADIEIKEIHEKVNESSNDQVEVEEDSIEIEQDDTTEDDKRTKGKIILAILIVCIVVAVILWINNWSK